MRSALPAASTAIATAFAFGLSAPCEASEGEGLIPTGRSANPERAVELLDHHVEVVIQNGFARTEVTQTFLNPNGRDLEAFYEFPVPRDGSLAETRIWAGESLLEGEVVPKEKAKQVYEEERDQGRDAGRAEKNSFYTYRFFVARVPAGAETKFQFAYYQPLEIDTGVGRYLYPLEEGGTEEAAASRFWSGERVAKRAFSFHAELKSAVPVDQVRVPGFEDSAVIQRDESGQFDVRIDASTMELKRDLVLYYRLADGLPGRIEVVPYRGDETGTGTFMVVVTPGIDLQPLKHGYDMVFILDVSGSMQGKLATLVDGVARTLGEFRAEDRFRIVTFNQSARELTSGWVAATPENVAHAIAEVKALRADGSTNLHDGISLGLKDLDDDRATSIILVTDAVTNRGEVRPDQFVKLLSQYDVRLFGFLLGNSGNWPLMRAICDASGGFYAGISNSDDLLGQIVLAKSKVTHESLHDAKLTVKGKGVHDTSRELLGKVYRGQQLVFFGRYDQPGDFEVTLQARMTGADKTYRTRATLPALDRDNPELERLWALNRIDETELRRDRGDLDGNEAAAAIADLGVRYQLVTDETSMLVAADEVFDRHGIARENRDRVATEHQAQAARRTQPVKAYRVDQEQPAFPNEAPTTKNSGGGKGAGAIDGSLALLAAMLVAGAAYERRSRATRRVPH